jgi:hypothetical protein
MSAYIVVFLLMGSFLLINLLVSVVVEKYILYKKRHHGEENLNATQTRWLGFSKRFCA